MYFTKTTITTRTKDKMFHSKGLYTTEIRRIFDKLDNDGFSFLTLNFFTPIGVSPNTNNGVIVILGSVFVSKNNYYNSNTSFDNVKEYIERFAYNEFEDINIVETKLITINEFNEYFKNTLTPPITDVYNNRFLSMVSDQDNSTLYMNHNDLFQIPIQFSYIPQIAEDSAEEFGSCINGSKYTSVLRDIGFGKYNGSKTHHHVFKCLARSRNNIKFSVDPIVTAMYKQGRVKSKYYTVIDLLSLIYYENVNFNKLNNIMNVLSLGGTVVLWVDIPNILYDDIEANDDPDSQEYHKTDRKFFDEDEEEYDDDEPREDNSEEKKNKEKLLQMKLDRYEEMVKRYDISRTLNNNNSLSSDFKFATQLIRGLVSMKEYNLKSMPIEVSNVIKMVMDNYKYINFIICYSDTIAASKNELFDFIIPKLSKEKSGIISMISDKPINSDNTFNLRNNIGDIISLYFQGLDDDTASKLKDSITDKIYTRLKSGTPDTSTFHYLSSIPMFTYFVCRMVDDALNNVVNDFEDDEFDKEMSTSIKKAMEKMNKEKKSDNIMDSTTNEDNDDYVPWGNDLYMDDRVEEDPKYKKKSDGNGTDVNSLDEMIGLTSVKQQIKDFASFMVLDALKKKREMKTVTPSRHMIFAGNPGTAKTTVAMLLAHILYENHTIARDNVVVVGRDQLVGKYVGWTAKNVEKYIKEAQGGILFVDEAYSLVDGYANSFGKEAIDTFVRYMDDKLVRENTIIIFAGYKKEMLEFCESNPGIRSRIGFIIDFPDYSTEELIDIAKLQAKNKGIKLSKGFLEELKLSIEEFKKEKSFGNGRFIRSVLEKSMMKQARRLCDKYGDDITNVSDHILMTLRREDFSTFGLKKSSDGTKTIGFGIKD